MHEVRKLKPYVDQLDDIRRNYAGVDLAISELEPTLARNPANYPTIIGKDISRIVVTPFDMPDIAIFFSYSDTEVFLLRAELLDAEE
jgi:hypothetical protein